MKRAFYCGLALAASVISPLIAADHPTVLFVRSGQTMVPVVGVEGTEPVVESDGKRVTIGSNAPFDARRAPYFGDGHVELRNVGMAGLRLYAVAQPTPEGSAITGRNSGSTSFFEADMRPDVELRGAFVAVIMFNGAFLTGGTDLPSPQILVHDLPTLPAGATTHVKFTAEGPGGNRFIVLVFAAGGAELKTNAASQIAEYFGRIERLKLAEAITKYRETYRGQDHGVLPVVQIRPTLPAGMTPPTTPITAKLLVTAEGLVGNVDVEGTADAVVLSVLYETMPGWLFLPRLKAGTPVAARVALPIVFGRDAGKVRPAP